MVRISWVTRARVAILTTALMTVGLVSTAQAQYFGQNKVQYDKFDFKILQTPHFDIYYYPAEANAAQAVGRMSERWYARLSGLFAHQLTGRQPIVLYASHPEFEQTNVIEGQIDEGTGGVTEGAKRRVVLPLAATLGETDHVLGHELVHAFQYDILGMNVQGAPLWFIEGMAEYVSLGARHAQTAIWLRDAAREDKLPAIKDLDNPAYFPYRFGHAFWAYIGGRWGDATIGKILTSLAPPDQGVVAGGIDPVGAIESATNMKQDELSKDWQRAIRAEYDVSAEPSKTFQAEGNLNVGPSLSPDGSKIAFLSERSRLSIDLYIADAATGKVLHKLTKSGVDPHFQSLQFLASAGSWDPQGQRLAVATVRNGRATIAIFDTNKGDVLQEIPFEPRGEVFQPSWSPDGNSIAFSAQVGGVTDLYLYDFTTKQTKQLTKDNFADLQPAWSSDGQRLAFVTDRYSSNLATLSFGVYGLAEINLASGQLSKIDTGLSGNTVDPQYTRDGKSLFFINDTTGRPDVYRMSTSGGGPMRLTSSVTGVSGITPLSPALSVASAGTRGAITVFRARGYQTQFLDDVTQGGLAVQPSTIDLALLPPGKRPPSTITQALQAPTVGLPPEQTYQDTDYSPKLELIDVSQQVGVATGGGFGTYVSGGISFLFSDVLGNHILNTVFDVQGGVKDIGAQATYLNRTHRWNWGAFGGRVPLYSGSVNAGYGTINGRTVYVEQTDIYRQAVNQGGALIAYPLSRATRLEFSTSANHITFDHELRTRIYDPFSGQLLDESTDNSVVAGAMNYGDVGAAIIKDTTAAGPVGPVMGERFRLEAAPTFGGLSMTNVSVDYRRYIMPVRPLTLAGRVLHVARYGPDSEDSRIAPFFLGYPDLVRGWDVNSFTANECSVTLDGSCPEFDRLIGSRMLVANLEARVPIPGVFTGRLNYGPFPVEAFGFLDSGVAWTRDTKPSVFGGFRTGVSSAGFGARVNVFGFLIAEFNMVKAINRPQKGWQYVFNFRPSF